MCSSRQIPQREPLKEVRIWIRQTKRERSLASKKKNLSIHLTSNSIFEHNSHIVMHIHQFEKR